MAIDTGALYYLVDPFVQWENVNGKPIVGGHVEVFEAGTDNKIITYADWDGTRHPFKIPLGSDGRAVILVDPGYRYDAYVYDSFNNLVCSRLNIIPLSDGDITIDGMGQVYHDDTLSGKGTPNSPLTVISGGKVYGGIYPIDVNNELDMISADNVPLGVQAPLYFAQDDDEGLVIALSSVPVPEGTMNESAFGYEDGKITGYNGTAFSAGLNYEAGSYVDITNNTISVTGLTPVPADTASTGLVASVSADITALIPDTSDMATQTWVNEQGFLTAHQDISDKLDTTAFSTVSGDFLTAIPSEYVTENTLQSGLSSKLDSTAFSTVSGNFLTAVPEGYATENWVTSQGYLTEHQSLDGLMSADLLESSGGLITGYNGTAFAGQGGGGVTGDYELSAGSGISIVDYPLEQKTVISVTAQGGNTAAEQAVIDNSATWNTVSDKLDTTAFSDVSGTFLTAHQDISNKLDTTAFSDVSGNFLTAVPDTYLQNSDLSTEDGKVTAISGIPLSAGGSVPTGVMTESGLEYDASGNISAYSGSAFAAQLPEEEEVEFEELDITSISAATDYVSANSANINSTVTNVSANSGAWGGSALPISAGPGIKFEIVDNTLVASTQGPILDEITTAGTWNGREVKQLLQTGTFETNVNSDVIPVNSAYSGAERKWIDTSNSYIFYGSSANILPSTWVLGATGRLGSLSLLNGIVRVRSNDTINTQCTAFVTIKWCEN